MKKKTFKNEAYIIDGKTDYLNFVTKSSTRAQREKFDIGDIYINAAICRECDDYIRSENRHDLKRCKCKAIAVDGGSWYCKRVGNPVNIIDVIEKFHK